MKKDSQHRMMMKRTANIYRHQKDRAQKAGMTLDYKLIDLRQLTEPVLGHPCSYCGDAVTAANVSFDHCDPVARGGAFSLANLDACCERCNQVKGVLTHVEFAGLLSYVLHLDPIAQRDVFTRLRAGGRIRLRAEKFR